MKVLEEVGKDVEKEVNVVEKDVEKVAQKVEQEFTQNHALEILVNAVKLAQKRGAYELEETEIILKAVKAFIQKVV